MRSAQALLAADPVLAAGIGVRRGRHWAVRAASFRVGPPMPGKSALGILAADSRQASALVDVLAGAARPAYGELRVLGQDMATVRGRAAVRGRVGVARRNARQLPGIRVRGLVEHAARGAQPGGDRQVLAAAILDRLSLSPWAEVPVRLAPAFVARRSRLAAAAVCQPELLLLDGLLDGLAAREAASLADAVCELCRDAGVLLTGTDMSALELVCDDIMMLADGVLVSG
ncbi:MAG TPA: ATP-binding cassette domain-containing protein [Streptosporangiaceae bacterium]|nr:ATP-binding cassette domain-containing protein [Streptosporangiaceae bacterium]